MFSDLNDLEIKKNELTQGTHGKLREYDKDSGKNMTIAATTILCSKIKKIMNKKNGIIFLMLFDKKERSGWKIRVYITKI